MPCPRSLSLSLICTQSCCSNTPSLCSRCCYCHEATWRKEALGNRGL
uniref:Uncharacterized protein n=1 Tax=Arundo donax TaxID=35708 RepID=A0A0A9AWB9_ARUDO